MSHGAMRTDDDDDDRLGFLWFVCNFSLNCFTGNY